MKYRLKDNITKDDLISIGIVTSFNKLLKREWAEGVIKKHGKDEVVYFGDILWVPLDMCEVVD